MTDTTAERHFAIYVYGDSLSLPRAQDGVRYYETYPELLRDAIQARLTNARIALYNRSQGGGFITSLMSSFENDGAYFGTDGVGILVIQCGIVDCAPRPVPTNVRQVIAKLPMPFRWAISKFLHHMRPYMLRAGMKWQLSTAEAYQQILLEWLRRAAPRFNTIYVVNIAPTIEAIESHSPGLTASIDAFNAVIDRTVRQAALNVKLIDVHAALSDGGRDLKLLININDGHHITRLGHELYASLIIAEEQRRLGKTTNELQKCTA